VIFNDVHTCLIVVLQHISAQELDEEKRNQAALTAELAELTGILKEATLQMNRSVVEQNQVFYLNILPEVLHME
jgi:hypothetical protein